MVIKSSFEYVMIDVNALFSIHFTDVLSVEAMLYLFSKCCSVNGFYFPERTLLMTYRC